MSLVGLIPVVTQYREETKLFTAGYVLLVAGMLATNVEVFLVKYHGPGDPWRSSLVTSTKLVVSDGTEL